MRSLVAASVLVMFVIAPSCQAQTASSTAALVGTWKVDLRPTPESPPHFQEFVVTKVLNDKSFEGTFYGAPISQARINSQWGTLRIAFVTSDGSGPYNHSAVLSGGKLEGMTNSTGRDFLAYWSAAKL